MKRHQDEIIIILVYLLGMAWVILNRFFSVDILLCPTKLLFDIPCPGCGMTRAVNLLMSGDIGGALMMNPNIIIVAFLFVLAPLLLICQIFTKRNFIGRINYRLDTPLFLVPFMLFEVFVWIYNIYRGI